MLVASNYTALSSFSARHRAIREAEKRQNLIKMDVFVSSGVCVCVCQIKYDFNNGLQAAT